MDNGSFMTKAGFAGDPSPLCVFPTIVGRPLQQRSNMSYGMKKTPCFVGDEPSRKGPVQWDCPLSRGVIHNFQDMEIIWRHTFVNELRVEDPFVVLLSETPLHPKANREKTTQIMFESFQVRALFVCNQAVLALFAHSGRTTGMVLDSGESVSHSVPVYEGHALKHAVTRVEMGGNEVTLQLCKLLGERGFSFRTSGVEKELVREIKQKLCDVMPSLLDFELEMKKHDKEDSFISNNPRSTMGKSYELPDGRILTIGSERFRCTEILFQPSLLDSEMVSEKSCSSPEGLHEALVHSISKCDLECRREFYSNIILSGGNTLFPGMPERIRQELVQMAPPSMQIEVVASPERKYSVWIGGSMLASMTTCFKSTTCMWKEEYDEIGPSLVHRKCF
ncbi:hypothetical protein FDP41_002138 [Naegleria fowleri]|uniref:Actin n=1 Tax=Naegleria fowleri TaxID=5763 RepID=A0A6A5BZI2_NAEFO|nr:uncharacterized protein FDP41_002138 [Naegleria fowleri]KAF0979068.1 hypothetical protein FDP41_002138 [Naegleria fowleri]